MRFFLLLSNILWLSSYNSRCLRLGKNLCLNQSILCTLHTVNKIDFPQTFSCVLLIKIIITFFFNVAKSLTIYLVLGWWFFTLLYFITTITYKLNSSIKLNSGGLGYKFDISFDTLSHHNLA